MVGYGFVMALVAGYCSMSRFYWASEASPTLGCSIEILRDIYVSVCTSWYAKVRRQKYVAQKCAGSVLGG